MRNDEWREESRAINFLGFKTIQWVLIGVALVLVVSGVIWFVRVQTSGTVGQLEAERQRNSAENWTRAQAEFQQRFNSIKALDRNIAVAAAAVKRTPTDQRRQIEYDGLVRNCNEAVGRYNALAQTFTAEKFRDASLPAELPDGPATDCKEN